MVEKASRLLVRILSPISGGILVIMVLLVTADVIGRYFGTPVPGTLEVLQLLLLMAVLFSLANTAAQRGHVAITILVSRFPPRAQAILTILTGGLALIVLCLMVYGGMIGGINEWKRGLLETVTLGIPVYPFKFVIPLGVFALCLVLLAQWLHPLGGLRKR